MAPGELLDGAVERTQLTEHVGKSGAALERVRLADGRAVIVKRITPATDLTLRLSGGTVAREYLLWSSGALDRLPDGVGHAIVDGWTDGPDTTVIVMRDLGDRVLTWDDMLSTDQCGWMLERLARMHRAFLGDPPAETAPLQPMLELFSPARMTPLAAEGNQLAALSLRGWDYFAELVPVDVADPVLGLLLDSGPLADALQDRPCTLVHGDLATVNTCFDDDELVLLDWAMPVAAPGALDVTRFLAGCSSVIEPSREEFLALYRSAAGTTYDARAMRLALLASLVWLGWNKALDIVEHHDPAKRLQEKDDLAWWVAEARTTLEMGDL